MTLFSVWIILSGSIFSVNPRPLQVGHAPKGLLKENILGSSSSMLTPCSGHASLVEKTCSFSKSLSLKWTVTRPSPSFMASSTASEMRLSCPGLMIILSTTISMVCLNFLSSLISSSFTEYISPSILTLVKPSLMMRSRIFSCSPLR